MATTPNQAIPYPAPSDAPDVPYWMQRLAERADSLFSTLFTVPPLGHMGKTGGFQGGNSAPGTTITMTQAQVLKGGMTFDDASDALVVPKDGLYRVTVQGMFSGAASGSNIAIAQFKRGAAAAADIGSPAAGPKPDSADVRYTATSMVPLLAGDKVSLLQKTAVSSWGTNGYDGSYLELAYITA